jgi:hypothetical protein
MASKAVHSTLIVPGERGTNRVTSLSASCRDAADRPCGVQAVRASARALAPALGFNLPARVEGAKGRIAGELLNRFTGFWIDRIKQVRKVVGMVLFIF